MLVPYQLNGIERDLRKVQLHEGIKWNHIDQNLTTMQILFKRQQQQDATSTVVGLGFTECKGRWSRSGECLLVGSAYKLQEYILYSIVYTYMYIIYIIAVNLPRYFHNTLSLENQLMVARFSPILSMPILRWPWGAKADCCATEVCTHGSVGCLGTRWPGAFLANVLESLWSWTHTGGVKLDVLMFSQVDWFAMICFLKMHWLGWCHINIPIYPWRWDGGRDCKYLFGV